MYRSLFSGDLFAELERIQREAQRLIGPGTSLRGMGRSSFPMLNVGGTANSIEIYAFAPGLDPAKIDVSIERGVLTLSGERNGALPAENDSTTTHIKERFTGRFSRVISLSDDADTSRVTAKYRDGVLQVSIKRSEAAQRRQITVK